MAACCWLTCCWFFLFCFQKPTDPFFLGWGGGVWLLSVPADEDVRQCEKAAVGGRWGTRQRSWAHCIHDWRSNLTCTGTKDLCQRGAAGCQKWRDHKSVALPDSSRFSRGHTRCERKSGWAEGWRALGSNSQAWQTCSNTIHPAACSCLQVNKADCNRRTSHQSTAGRTTASGARLSWYGADGTASVGVAPRHTTSSPSGPVLTSGEKTYGMWWDKTHADNPRQPNAPRELYWRPQRRCRRNCLWKATRYKPADFLNFKPN